MLFLVKCENRILFETIFVSKFTWFLLPLLLWLFYLDITVFFLSLSLSPIFMCVASSLFFPSSLVFVRVRSITHHFKMKSSGGTMNGFKRVAHLTTNNKWWNFNVDALSKDKSNVVRTIQRSVMEKIWFLFLFLFLLNGKKNNEERGHVHLER